MANVIMEAELHTPQDTIYKAEKQEGQGYNSDCVRGPETQELRAGGEKRLGSRERMWPASDFLFYSGPHWIR